MVPGDLSRIGKAGQVFLSGNKAGGQKDEGKSIQPRAASRHPALSGAKLRAS